jgi:hypothetical protein
MFVRGSTQFEVVNRSLVSFCCVGEMINFVAR